MQLQMFTRTNKTYNYDQTLIDNILKDDANPLNRISAIIPESSTVLDIGAGNGILAKVLKKTHSKLIIDGIEPNPHAAKIAKNDYRNFYCNFFQNVKHEIDNEHYDFIILADVIEHTENPLQVLQDLSLHIQKNTKIILSVPNVAFGSVRISLLNGKFDYTDSGILEKTHLRFFTLKTIKKIISNTKFKIETLYFLQRNFLDTEIQDLDINFLSFYKIYKDELSSVYQFLLVLCLEGEATEEKYFGTKLKHPIKQYFSNKLFNATRLKNTE